MTSAMRCALCACEQGLSLGSGPACNVPAAGPGPGLVFCYTDPGCPAVGRFYTQAELVGYEKLVGLGPGGVSEWGYGYADGVLRGVCWGRVRASWMDGVEGGEV